MKRAFYLAMAGMALASCGTFDATVPGNPPREVFGVSAAPPAGAAPGDDTRKTLEWKVSQICVNGHDLPAEAVEPAEENRQMVDWQLRCRRYQLGGLPFPRSDWFDFQLSSFPF